MKNFRKYSNDSGGKLECYFQTILAMITAKEAYGLSRWFTFNGKTIECIRDSMFYLVLNQLHSFTTEIIFILKFILILHPDSKEFEIF